MRVRCCTLLLYVRLPHAEGAKMAEALLSGYQPQTIRVSGGRNLGYCLYGPGDGVPVVFFYGTPGTMFLAPDRLVPVDELGIRLLVVDRPGYGIDPAAGPLRRGSRRRRGRPRRSSWLGRLRRVGGFRRWPARAGLCRAPGRPGSRAAPAW